MKEKKETIYLKVKVNITHDEDDPESRISAVKTAAEIVISTNVIGYPISVYPVEVKEISKEIQKPIIIKEKIENIQPLIKNRFIVSSAYINQSTDVNEKKFDTLFNVFEYLNEFTDEELMDRIVTDIHDNISIFVVATDVVQAFSEGECPEDLSLF